MQPAVLPPLWEACNTSFVPESGNGFGNFMWNRPNFAESA